MHFLQPTCTDDIFKVDKVGQHLRTGVGFMLYSVPHVEGSTKNQIYQEVTTLFFRERCKQKVNHAVFKRSELSFFQGCFSLE